MGAFPGHQPHAGVRTGTGRGDGSAAAPERRVSRTGRCDGSQQTAPQPRRGFAGCPRRHGRQVRAMEGKRAAGAGRPGGVSCKGWRPRFCTCDSASCPAGTAASQDVPQPPSGLTGPCVSQMGRDGMGRSRTRDRSDCSRSSQPSEASDVARGCQGSAIRPLGPPTGRGRWSPSRHRSPH